MVERNHRERVIEGQNGGRERVGRNVPANGVGGAEGFVGVPFHRGTETVPDLTALTLLLRCVADLDYNPPTWTGQLVQRQAKHGTVPSLKVLCPNCDGDKARRVRGIPQPCTFCLDDEGNPLGWIWVDGNLNESFQKKLGGEGTRTIVHLATVRCSECGGTGRGRWWMNGDYPTDVCRTCRGAKVEEVPLSRLQAAKSSRLTADASELGPGDPVIAAMDRRDKAGDFEQLGLALAALRLDLPSAYRTVVRVYVEAALEPDELSAAALLRHDVGLRYLRRLMPDEIRVPTWAARNERRRRERLRKRQREETAA